MRLKMPPARTFLRLVGPGLAFVGAMVGAPHPVHAQSTAGRETPALRAKSTPAVRSTADGPTTFPSQLGRLRPVLGGPWQPIVEYPGFHLNDFTLFRANDARWHAIGIIGNGHSRSEVSLFHASSARLLGPFEHHPALFTALPPGPDSEARKHAPHVVTRDGALHLFYRRPGGTLMHVRGRDPFTWDGLGEEIFTERDARDPCIVQDGGRYIMYYCQSKEFDGVLRSAILARTSPDLETWSDAVPVLVDEKIVSAHSKLESPFVLRRSEGWYLFISNRRTWRPQDDPKRPPPVTVTTVSFSPDPLDFGHGDRPWFQEFVGVHAPEIVEEGGRTWIVRVATEGRTDNKPLPGLTGRLFIAPLRWEPDTPAAASP